MKTYLGEYTNRNEWFSVQADDFEQAEIEARNTYGDHVEIVGVRD